MFPASLAVASDLISHNLLFAVAAGGVMLILFGIWGVYSQRDLSARRLRMLGASAAPRLAKGQETAPHGLMKSLVPEDPSERAQIRFQLARVGLDHADAVRDFFLLRLFLAVFPVIAVLSAWKLAHLGLLPQGMRDLVLSQTHLRLMQVAGVGLAIGFYGPGYWLKSRMNARRDRIRNGFPNALDLLQISVEAGMGFDAALSRVGQEIGRVSPEIAYEFLLLQHEIGAGRDRERAMFDMAERMGIDEAKSFVLVIVQSLQFGTSLTTALKTYAIEMRQNRELKAQEKANRLPVQMSAAMSLLMLPALFLITLTPIVLRYIAIY